MHFDSGFVPGTNSPTKVALKSEFPRRVVLPARHPTILRDVLLCCMGAVFGVLLIGRIAAPSDSRAAIVGANSMVIVNSASSRHLEFRNNIQPGLDNFGVPHSVMVLKTNAVTTSVTQHAPIIIGHQQRHTNHISFDSSVQSMLSLAVSNDTGLVNFDSSDYSLSFYDLGLCLPQ
jgi:hypothetical protein